MQIVTFSRKQLLLLTAALVVACAPLDVVQVEQNHASGICDASFFDRLALLDGGGSELALQSGIQENIEECKAEAARGNPRAQFILGRLYTSKNLAGVRFDLAADWYKKSAALGFPLAQYDLGILYRDGLGVDQDFEMAAYWLSQAAEGGVILAYPNLANLYRKGSGVPKDLKKAHDLHRYAAEKGSGLAQYNLAKMYLNGEAEGKPDIAYAWMRQASQSNEKLVLPLAMLEVGVMTHRGEGTESNPSLACDYFKSASVMGQARATYYLAMCYLTGSGREVNVGQAVSLLKSAAAQQDPDAALVLGMLYVKGEHLPEDLDEGIKWLHLASDNGSQTANALLAEVQRRKQQQLDAMLRGYYDEAYDALGKGNAQRAENLLTRILEYDKTKVDIFVLLGIAQGMQNRYEESIATLQEADRRFPDSEPVLSNLGFSWASAGNYVKAIDYYQRALAIDPNNQKTQYNYREARLKLWRQQ